VAPKQPGETRIVMLGGSTAFGYGSPFDRAPTGVLERLLNDRPAPGGGRFVVVNLAYLNEAAYSLRYTLEDYAFMAPDIAVLYEGYNDLGTTRHQVFRRESPIFRLTGYLPIFPLVFREKARSLMYGGDIDKAYRTENDSKTPVFRPGLATRATSDALEAAAATAKLLEDQLGRLSPDHSAVARPDNGCNDRWKNYCGSMAAAVEWARMHGMKVIVGTQPYISDHHVAQQAALTAWLTDRFGHDPGVALVNLGEAVNLHDPALAYDGMHLTDAGNAVIAAGLVEPVRQMAARARQ
jgi:hypothetical protein